MPGLYQQEKRDVKLKSLLQVKCANRHRSFNDKFTIVICILLSSPNLIHIPSSQQTFQHAIQHSKFTCSMKWHQHNSICYFEINHKKRKKKKKKDSNGKLHWNSSGWNEMCWIFRGHINWCNTRKILIF